MCFNAHALKIKKTGQFSVKYAAIFNLNVCYKEQWYLLEECHVVNVLQKPYSYQYYHVSGNTILK